MNNKADIANRLLGQIKATKGIVSLSTEVVNVISEALNVWVRYDEAMLENDRKLTDAMEGLEADRKTFEAERKVIMDISGELQEQANLLKKNPESMRGYMFFMTAMELYGIDPGSIGVLVVDRRYSAITDYEMWNDAQRTARRLFGTQKI